MRERITVMKMDIHSVNLFFPLSLIFTLLFLLQPVSATADTNCHMFDIDDSPLGAAPIRKFSKELWCYWKLPDGSGTLIYNADSEQAKAELSAFRSSDGTVLFASLLKGDLRVFQAFDHSPFHVPLEEPFRVSDIPAPPQAKLADSAKDVLNFLLTSDQESILFALREGSYFASVPDSALPWRGYWWPYSSRRLAADRVNSPLAKYDRFAAALTGVNPGARAWELENHSSHVRWYGHCNGWAAAAILRKEPTAARLDLRTGIRFSVSDQKGLLAEDDMCVKFRFIGRRYNGPGDDIWDIPAHVFHKTIEEQIGFLRKPLLMDHDRQEQVWNVVVSGYRMTIKNKGPNQWHVTTELNTHPFDNQMSDAQGPAPLKVRVYRYELTTDSRGAVVNGRWLSLNPDFLWVPLSPHTCEGSNEKLDPALVDLILNQLPLAR
jgi:hypothetical protein